MLKELSTYKAALKALAHGPDARHKSDGGKAAAEEVAAKVKATFRGVGAERAPRLPPGVRRFIAHETARLE